MTVGLTGPAPALPGLVADARLQYNPSTVTDPYRAQVFDLTHW